MPGLCWVDVIQYFLVVTQKKSVPVSCMCRCRYVDIWAKCNSFCAKFGKHNIAKKCVWTQYGLWHVTRDTWHLAEFWWNNSSQAPGTGISEQWAAAAGIWGIKCWQCRTQTCRGCTNSSSTVQNKIIYFWGHNKTWYNLWNKAKIYMYEEPWLRRYKPGLFGIQLHQAWRNCLKFNI